MSVKNVISWHSAFTCSFGTLSPGLKSYLVHQVVKWEESMPITPWWPTLKTKNNVIFWIYLRILHQISVTTRKLITCFKVTRFSCNEIRQSNSLLIYRQMNRHIGQLMARCITKSPMTFPDNLSLILSVV